MTQPNDPLELNVEVYKSLLEMLQRLRNLPDLKGDGNLTRNRAIEVLNILLEPLSETLQVNVGEMDDGTPIVTDHHSMVTLLGLRKSLEDLDKHIVDPMVKPQVKVAKGGDGWRIREMSRALGEVVRVHKAVRGLKTDRAAASELIRKPSFKDIVWKGAKLSIDKLLRMRYPN